MAKKRKSSGPTELSLHCYPATVTRVFDGSVCLVEVDLGLGLTIKDIRVKLARIKTHEIRGIHRDKGIAARDWLAGMVDPRVLEPLDRVQIQIIKVDPDSRGARYLVEMVLKHKYNVSDRMVEKGHAKYE